MSMHPAQALFYLTLFTSVAITTSSNSWFIAWLGLELNLLAFIPLTLNKKNKYSVESALKYFLIQSVSSVFIIMASSMGAGHDFSIVLLLMLLMKSGAAPSHQWMPAMVDGLSWPIFTVLMTLQKTNPLIMIFFLSKTAFIYWITIGYILMSALIGALGGLTQTSMRKIIAYSSIAHLAWMLAALMHTSWLWTSYFIVYTFVIMSVTLLLHHTQTSTLNHVAIANKSYLALITAVSILSLGGLPPFTGFLCKLLVVQYLVSTPENFILAPLLASAYISLFFYARVLLASLILASSSQGLLTKFKFTNSSLLIANMVALLAPTIAVVLL
uniref:NADH-ubiquinone oxidoreductase chain 2 n=1 Tax=Acanthogammarus victorii TaxID=65437 RepID=A0A1L5BW67_9CRUS|nr:NADH dehydrogenase subunit 2 [Acanthogammarus victorii]